MEPGFKVRDTRLLFGGRFKTKRPFTWQAGVMYDGKTESWFVRQTGLMVAIPELWGNVFDRARQGGGQSQQGDERVRRLDDGAIHVQ